MLEERVVVGGSVITYPINSLNCCGSEPLNANPEIFLGICEIFKCGFDN